MTLHRESIDREGWQLFVATAMRPPAELANAQPVERPDAELAQEVNSELVAQALAATRGSLGPPFRRSRHAVTYWVRIGGGVPQNGDAFVKVLDARRGLGKLKQIFRRSRGEHVASIVNNLVAAGINAAPVLLYGRETATKRGMIVTARAQGEALPRALRMTAKAGLAHKRALLHALGEEVARIHSAGFVHGDLTPYNVIVERGEPPRFVFIDHERTCRAPIVGRMHSRLRNLVQLGRLELPGITRADRVRVLRAYADALFVRNRRRLMRRTVSMLARRLERDGGRANKSPE